MTDGLTDRYLVERDGERVEVYNWVNISTYAVVRGYNPTVENFPDETDIECGDLPSKPDAVTPEVAEELWHEFGIEVEDHGIETIDPDDDGVTVI